MDSLVNNNTPRERHIALSHGNGGRMMRELIEGVFVAALANPGVDTGADAVPLMVPVDRELMITTDCFTVQPLEFPGGDIGSLAVHGTVNDLAVAGATPHFLTLNAFIEEGLEIDTLARVDGLRFMRDPTRGGLATVMHEVACDTSLAVQLEEAAISLNDAAQSVCELLGYDPLYLACEGRVVAVVYPSWSRATLETV